MKPAPRSAARAGARQVASERLYSVEAGTSAQTVAKMLRVLYPDATSVLDATWGTGGFWSADVPVLVTGLDLSPHGTPDVLGDFTRLPFRDDAFDVVVFDPPFISHASKAGTSKVDRRFSSYRSEDEALSTVQGGAREAWRVSRLGILVKVQNHVHASVYVDMEAWVREALVMPVYGHVEQIRPSKMIAPSWTDQLSVWSNSATFLAFRHGDQRHIRRTPTEADAGAQQQQQRRKIG